MIRGFACKETKKIYDEKFSRKLPGNIQRGIGKKLALLDAAVELDDLKVPPGNQLEPLKGDRRGWHSIRINDQWRICFRWTKEGPAEVEVVDYH